MPDRFWTPFSNLAGSGRAIVKALLLLLAFDVFQQATQLPTRLANLSLLKHFTPPMARLRDPSDKDNPVWWPLGPLLDAHEIGQPKGTGEFRVATLGDSSVFCDLCSPEETVSGQLTRLSAKISERDLRAYNLGYKWADWLKDLLILEHATLRQLDAVVWFVTLYRAADRPFNRGNAPHSFVTMNAADLQRLVDKYAFSTWETRKLLGENDAWHRSLFQDGGTRLRDFTQLVGKTILAGAVPGDASAKVLGPAPWVGTIPVKPKARFNSGTEGFDRLPNARWELLKVGARMAHERGIRLLIVNEPIFLANGPNTDVNYNARVERALFDRYRDVLKQFTAENGIDYLDLWNLLPGEEFSDTDLHHTGLGNLHLAEAIAPKLREMASR